MKRFPEKRIGALVLRWRRLKDTRPKSYAAKSRRTGRLAKWQRHFIRDTHPLFVEVVERFKAEDPRWNGATVEEMLARIDLRVRKWFRLVQPGQVQAELTEHAIISCTKTVPVEGRMIPRIKARILNLNRSASVFSVPSTPA